MTVETSAARYDDLDCSSQPGARENRDHKCRTNPNRMESSSRSVSDESEKPDAISWPTRTTAQIFARTRSNVRVQRLPADGRGYTSRSYRRDPPSELWSFTWSAKASARLRRCLAAAEYLGGAGLPQNHPALRAACRRLLRYQLRAMGGVHRPASQYSATRLRHRQSIRPTNAPQSPVTRSAARHQDHE